MYIYIPFPCPVVHFTTYSHSSTGNFLSFLFSLLSSPSPTPLFGFICFLVFICSMSVRRSKAMPTDGPTAKFLYTIIKQLDLKSVSILSTSPRAEADYLD